MIINISATQKSWEDFVNMDRDSESEIEDVEVNYSTERFY